VLLAAGMSANAQMTEETARQAAQELRVLVTEGTGVVGDLQPAINGSKTTKEQVRPGRARERIQGALSEEFRKRVRSESPPESWAIRGRRVTCSRSRRSSRASRATSRRAARTHSFRHSSVRRRSTTSTSSCTARWQGYATNRDNELINGDWAVNKVMKGSPLAGDVKSLMESGGLEPVVKRNGNTVMGYYPNEACAGHASPAMRRNGPQAD